MKVPDTQARCDFENIPSGTYALVVLHDENMNGKLVTNWLGIPREGYGFSNDAKVSFSTPSFSDAAFAYDGQTLDLTIKFAVLRAGESVPGTPGVMRSEPPAPSGSMANVAQ